MVVWERGAGITLACGTGACATVVAGVLEGRLDQSCQYVFAGRDVSPTFLYFGPAKMALSSADKRLSCYSGWVCSCLTFAWEVACRLPVLMGRRRAAMSSISAPYRTCWGSERRLCRCADVASLHHMINSGILALPVSVVPKDTLEFSTYAGSAKVLQIPD